MPSDGRREDQAAMGRATAWPSNNTRTISPEQYRVYPLAALSDDLASHAEELLQQVRDAAVSTARLG